MGSLDLRLFVLHSDVSGNGWHFPEPAGSPKSGDCARVLPGLLAATHDCHRETVIADAASHDLAEVSLEGDARTARRDW